MQREDVIFFSLFFFEKRKRISLIAKQTFYFTARLDSVMMTASSFPSRIGRGGAVL